jgi:GTP-binding protein Era
VIVYLADATEGTPPSLETAAELERLPAARVITALNKSDLLRQAQRDQLSLALPEAIFVSAMTGEGIDALRMNIVAALPESPFLYDADDVSTQSMRFFTSELVRETALEQLSDEVPYSVACEIEEFREDRSPVYIRAVIYVERDSQKRILIGNKGTRIREIGKVARTKIEALVGSPVYLDLWVKVLDNWRRNTHALERFGYSNIKDSRT